ncbi:hypothetical protein ACIQB5_13175 [Streptomyces sp. NPDC088560]|uniref:hypothetical protein n=1 Tax=Streptomyces sp. NPDC088560 TaxID=3365868 RepID=UPI0038284CE2
MRGNERGAKSALRDRLLPETIRHAEAIPFYAEHWGRSASGEIATTDALARLPVVGRDELAEHGDRMVHPERTPSVMLHSTGTTTGQPVRRFRCAEELAALDSFRHRLSAKARARRGESNPIVHFTTLSARHHGAVLGARTGAQRAVSLSLLTAREVERSVALLARDRLFPDLPEHLCEYELSGSPQDLTLLATVLSEPGNEAARRRIRRIVAVADFLSRAQQDLLTRTVPESRRVVHRYSLSEVAGGATRCERCSLFHFDAIVVPEVVPLDGGDPVREGVGRLVLTELYPFSQAQPLIRYDTGDLVEAVRSDCDAGELSVALLGRTALVPTVRARGGRVPVFRPYALRETAERLPELCHAPVSSLAPWQSTAGTIPLVACAFRPAAGRAPHRLTVRAAVGFPPRLLPEAAAGVLEQLRAAVLASSPELMHLVTECACELRIEITGDSSAVPPLATR